MTAEKPSSSLTKRQKRKLGPNPSNTWPQQPKIKSTESRNKAYLANAGFTKNRTSDTHNNNNNAAATKSSTSTSKKDKLDPNLDVINSPEYKFGRLLASPNARTRHATVLKLKAYLRARCAPPPPPPPRDDEEEENEDEGKGGGGGGGGLSQLDFLKLWKGLWHTLYLCDGVVVQEEVSKILAQLIWSVGGTEEEDEYAARLYLDMTDEKEGSGNGSSAEADEMDVEKEEEDANDDDDEDAEMMDNNEVDTGLSLNDIGKEDNNNNNNNEDDDKTEEEDETNTRHCRGAHLSALFVRTYFQTLSREWSNMDKYRIDKFYTLTRLVLREVYKYMATRHWNLGIVRLFNDALFEEVLRSTKTGNGIRFHLIDICLEELALVNSDEGIGLKLTEATVLDCLEPFFAMVQRVDDKVVHARVMEKVILNFLNEYSVVSSNYDDIEDENDEDAVAKKALVMDEVHVGTVAQFIFELASDAETMDRYRKELYEMHKTFVRKIKEVKRDVALEEFDEEEEYNEEEGVPEEGGMMMDGAEDVTAFMVEEEDGTVTEVATPSKKKQKKAKKEKKQKSVDKAEPPKAVAKETENGDNNVVDQSAKKKKKKKKAKKETPVKKVEAEPSEPTTEEIEKVDGDGDDDVNKSAKKKQRKRQKKQKKNQNAVEKGEEEETITISIEEQTKAAESEKKKPVELSTPKKTPKKKKEVSENLMSSCKKVKFGKMNISKSHKASIRDLKKIDPKIILERTPDKSILLSNLKKRKSISGNDEAETPKSTRKRRNKKKSTN